MLIYLSGPYSHKHWWRRVKNIYLAWRASAKLWDEGHTVICPHTNTMFFEYITKLPYKSYIKRDLLLVELCDTLALLPGWEKSHGAMSEYWLAHKLNKEIVFL